MAAPLKDPSHKVRRFDDQIDRTRVFNTPGVVLLLAGVTIAAFLILGFSPSRAARLIEVAGAISPRKFLAGPEANNGVLSMLSPLVSHMFLHAGPMHLIFNMFWLLAVGTPVARRLGAENALQSFPAFAAASLFLSLYFLSGAAGALLHILLHSDEAIMLVGASGGVMGLLGAVVRFGLARPSLFGPEQGRIAPLFSAGVLTWTGVVIAMNAFAAMFGGSMTGGAKIAWAAHLGGYFFGLLAYPQFERFARAYR